MKKLLIAIGIIIVIVLAVISIKTALFTSKLIQVLPAVELTIDVEQSTQRLAQILRFRTISNQDSTKFDESEFYAMHAYFVDSFPELHAVLKREFVNDYSLLYTWPGSDPNLKPILLMAHQDVVPVIPGTENVWDNPPFDGKISESYIWGRGALDDKSSMTGILEAVEALLRDGFQPQHTIYLAFGHDEELGGKKGAAKIAELLKSRNVQLEYVLDEGGLIIRDMIPGVSVPVALVGIAEKGYVSLELSVQSEGGHSSMPPKNTAVGILCKAITKLEENPFPANMAYSSQFFNYVAPEMPFLQKMVFANQWLFNPVLANILSKTPEMNATIRTTTAATMFSGSVKENVLPIKANAVVNFRILPGENVDSVIDHVKNTIDDPRVTVKTLTFGSNPSPVSDIHSDSYQVLQKTILQVAGGEALIVAPYLVVGATDSRYYTGLSNNVFRFVLIQAGPEDVKRAHGTNERISIENYMQAAKFYYQLLRNSNEIEMSNVNNFTKPRSFSD